MSKYNALWEHIRNDERPELTLTFDEIRSISGTPLDHSFLNFKNELFAYGYAVGKISMKTRTVKFHKTAKAETRSQTQLTEKYNK